VFEKRNLLGLYTGSSGNSCNETNLMHYLSSVYSLTILLHVSGLIVARHQEVTMYICDNWYVLYILVDFGSLPPQQTATFALHNISRLVLYNRGRVCLQRGTD
jgi:hypothetical protein